MLTIERSKLMAKNNLKAEVTEVTNNGLRTITIIVTGDADDFQFADMLAQRKIIQPITNVVRQAALDGTSRYLQSAETVLSGAKKETAEEAETVSKRGRKNKDAGLEKEASTASAVANNGSGNGAAVALSGD